jgi:hypothetical protein
MNVTIRFTPDLKLEPSIDAAGSTRFLYWKHTSRKKVPPQKCVLACLTWRTKLKKRWTSIFNGVTLRPTKSDEGACTPLPSRDREGVGAFLAIKD